MTDTTIAPMPAMLNRAGGISPLQSRRFLPALTILFIGSGCAALIYEIVWLQLLGLVIGVSAVSLGVLLGTFMGGMCIGSLLFPRLVSRRFHPLVVYAVLELAIGAMGIIEIGLVPLVSHLYVHLATTGTMSIVLRALLAGICLLPPTILMGATLPAIARWVEATPKGVSWLGFFYGGNIMGAVVGCLAAGFYLLPHHDMSTVTLVAAAINAAVASLGLVLASLTRHEVSAEDLAQDQAPRMPLTGEMQLERWTVFTAIALSGLTALGAEVIWTRLLSLMLGATVYTFSIILAVFLLGLGIGSSVGSFMARTTPSPRAALAACQFLLAAAIAWAAYSISNALPFWPIEPGDSMDPSYMFQMDIARACWALLPAAVLWGASFPLALGSLARRGQDAGKLVGGVYAANTVGAIIGSLAFSMFLVPGMGTQNCQRLIMVLCAVSAVVALLPILARPRSREESAGFALPVAMIGGLAICLWMVVEVSPPNWPSIAWGRNSASEMMGEVWDNNVRHPIFPAVVSDEEVKVLQEAQFHEYRTVGLKNGNVWFDPAGMNTEVRKDTEDWISSHHDELLSILKKRFEVTGEANLFGYAAPGGPTDVLPTRFCTFIGEGRNVSVAVTVEQIPGTTDQNYRYFHGAGKVQASSDPADMHLQRMLGHISALMKPDPKDVLVVACGAGVTAGSFVPYGSNITIVDIEPMVPKYVTPQFHEENHDVIPPEISGRPTGYTKTKVVIDDGRHFIETSPDKYDVITSDPIDPWVKGCAALNTVEYYQFCRDHLKPGGVMALWIPLYESREETSKSIIATFFKVFPNGIVFSNENGGFGYDCILFAKLGEDGGVDQPTHIDLDAIQKYIDAPGHEKIKESIDKGGFGARGVGPGDDEAVQLFATFAGTGPNMTPWTAGTEDLINWDSNLRLQYIAGRWVNEHRSGDILNGMLACFQYPDKIFTGSADHLAALQQMFSITGRVPKKTAAAQIP